MSLSARPTAILLRRPAIGEKCIEEYEVQGIYGVCIAESGVYIVYDKVSLRKDLDPGKSVEEFLRKVVLSGEKDLAKIVEKSDPSIKHVLERQFFGYGLLEPLIMDENIVDIHVVSGKPVRVMHRKHGDLDTNISLSDEELKEIVLRISTLAGKVISEANPIASFIEPRYETRVSIVYLSDVTLRRGMTVDIRKQPKKPWSILKLVDLGTLSIDEAAFLWLMVKYKVPIMVVGEMMSGKTTLATAILNLIPPKSKVITVEDTPEIRLCTPYWTRTTTRETAENPITVFSLLKVAVRLSVDYVVVGEVRGEEAREWAQAILLGHGAVTTFHADSPESALLRLTTPPILVNPQALRMLNVFVKTTATRREAALLRRSEVYVYDYDSEKGDLSLTPLFTYDPRRDAIAMNPKVERPVTHFPFFKRVSMAHGVTVDELEEEYKAMRRVIGEVYTEAKKADSSLEYPDICELSNTLYTKLSRVKSHGV